MRNAKRPKTQKLARANRGRSARRRKAWRTLKLTGPGRAPVRTRCHRDDRSHGAGVSRVARSMGGLMAGPMAGRMQHDDTSFGTDMQLVRT